MLIEGDDRAESPMTGVGPGHPTRTCVLPRAAGTQHQTSALLPGVARSQFADNFGVDEVIVQVKVRLFREHSHDSGVG